MSDEAPDELRRLIPQTGAEWEGVTEVEINLDIAQRVGVILNSKGVAVDILPTTIPVGYVADAFVALPGVGPSFPAAAMFCSLAIRPSWLSGWIPAPCACSESRSRSARRL